MAVLIGILLGLSRLAADSEVTAMRASGLGVVSASCGSSAWSRSSAGWPAWRTRFTSLRTPRGLYLNYEEPFKTSQATVEVQPRVFYEDFKNYVLYTQERDDAEAAGTHRGYLAVGGAAVEAVPYNVAPAMRNGTA